MQEGNGLPSSNTPQSLISLIWDSNVMLGSTTLRKAQMALPKDSCPASTAAADEEWAVARFLLKWAYGKQGLND